MSEELKKWFADFLNSIAEKIKRGEKLSSVEIEIASDYVSNLQLFEYVDKRISDLEKKIEVIKSDLEKKIEGVRGELLKRIEGVDAKVDVVRSDLKKKIEATRSDLEKRITETRDYLEKKIEAIRSDLEKKVEATRSDLEKKIEATRNDLEKKIAETRDYLEKKVDMVRSDLEKKVETVRSDLDKKIDATRSDLGLLTEEVYVKNFIDYLEKSGERVISVYRHYESNAGEIDAFVETQTRVYVVEVKMRAELKDVDDLISKAKAVGEEYKGKDVIPVLTGAKISEAVRGYAKGLNVMVA